MKSKRIYIYFLKVIKRKLYMKMKMKTNSNSLHKLEYRTYNQLFNQMSHFLRLKKLQVIMSLILLLYDNIILENIFKYDNIQ